MCFLAAGPVVSVHMIFAEFPHGKNCGSFFKKHTCHEYRSNSLTYTVASLVCTSPLAVITVVGFFDILMVSNSAELRSFLLTLCILARESATSSLSSSFFVDATRSTHFSAGEWNAALVFLLELLHFFGKVPRLASGTSLLSISLFMGPVLKFHSARTSLMRNFDTYFSKRWSFLFPDTCLTKRGLSEPYFSNRSQDFLHRVSPGLFASLRNQRIRVLRGATQLWYNFHHSHSVLVIAFSSFVGKVAFLWFFVWLFVNLIMREQTLIPGFAARFCFVKLTLGRMQIFTRRSRARTFSNSICTDVEEWHHGYFCLGYFFSSTHFDLGTRMAQKVWRHGGLVFCARSSLSCRKLRWSPFEHWTFSFHG